MTESCLVQAEEFPLPIGSPHRIKVNLTYRLQAQGIYRQVTEYVLPKGIFLDSVVADTKSEPSSGDPCRDPPYVLFASIGITNWNYSYEGDYPCPAQAVYRISYPIIESVRRALEHALTDRPFDAVYRELENNTWVYKFRGESLPNTVGYVSDASPIGEVFFATVDLSIFVHEPKPGNMPVLTREMIPGGIVTLLSAIWM